MAAISQTDDTFICIFLNKNEKQLISIKILLTFVLKGAINNIPSLGQIMALRKPSDERYIFMTLYLKWIDQLTVLSPHVKSHGMEV